MSTRYLVISTPPEDTPDYDKWEPYILLEASSKGEVMNYFNSKVPRFREPHIKVLEVSGSSDTYESFIKKFWKERRQCNTK